MAEQQKNPDKKKKRDKTEQKPIAHMREITLRYRGVILMFVLDILFCMGAFWATRFAMFKEVDYPLNYLNFEIPIMIIMVTMPVCMLALFNCYNVVWKFAGRIEFIKFVGAYVVSFAFMCIVKIILIASFNVELWGTQIALYHVLALVLTATTRFFNMLIGYFKHVRRGGKADDADGDRIRTVIYGAGNIGSVLNNRFINNPAEGYLPVAFIDDDPDKHGMFIGGNPVAGGLDDIEKIVAQYEPDMFVIAITDLTKSQLNGIYERFAKFKLPIKMLPPISI